jgi:multiple sugar transport system permease protein
MRQQRPGVGIFRTIFFMPVVIGLAAASYLWVWLVQSGIGPVWNFAFSLGLADRTTNWLASPVSAVAIVIIMVVWKAVGLQMLLQMSGLQSIPPELEEAARIDGASRGQVLVHILLPLLRPTFAMLMVFSVGGSLLAFDQFYIMTGGGPAKATTTAVFSIYRSSFVSYELGYGAALSLVLLVVLACVSALQFVIMPRQETQA